MKAEEKGSSLVVVSIKMRDCRRRQKDISVYLAEASSQHIVAE